VKHVYDPPTMSAVRRFFEREVADRLPAARILYFT
jgi:spore photoproduct lyase